MANPHIISKSYRWAHPLVHRIGGPPGIVWHHAAGTGSPNAIHATHLRIGDSGIAYHYYVRRDGRIYRGRPEWAMGAHCLGHNNWLGVCAEGNYDVVREMPAKQLRSLQWLHDDIHRRRKGIVDRRHKNMSGNATACPGRYYPYSKVVSGASKPPAKPKKIALTDKNITVPRMYKPGRAGWWNLGLAPWIKKIRAQGDGDRVVSGDKDPLIIPVPAKRPRWWGKLYRWKKNRQ